MCLNVPTDCFGTHLEKHISKINDPKMNIKGHLSLSDHRFLQMQSSEAFVRKIFYKDASKKAAKNEFFSSFSPI